MGLRNLAKITEFRPLSSLERNDARFAGQRLLLRATHLSKGDWTHAQQS
jgi:hypothetical protein